MSSSLTWVLAMATCFGLAVATEVVADVNVTKRYDFMYMVDVCNDGQDPVLRCVCKDMLEKGMETSMCCREQPFHDAIQCRANVFNTSRWSMATYASVLYAHTCNTESRTWCGFVDGFERIFESQQHQAQAMQGMVVLQQQAMTVFTNTCSALQTLPTIVHALAAHGQQLGSLHDRVANLSSRVDAHQNASMQAAESVNATVKSTATTLQENVTLSLTAHELRLLEQLLAAVRAENKVFMANVTSRLDHLSDDLGQALLKLTQAAVDHARAAVYDRWSAFLTTLHLYTVYVCTVVKDHWDTLVPYWRWIVSVLGVVATLVRSCYACCRRPRQRQPETETKPATTTTTTGTAIRGPFCPDGNACNGCYIPYVPPPKASAPVVLLGHAHRPFRYKPAPAN